MKVYVVEFNYNKKNDKLVFSDTDYLIEGLITYIKKDDTDIAHTMKEYFEKWQKENYQPWEWLFTDIKYWFVNSLEHLLKPFGCKIDALIVDQGLC